ncbi:hypothetical protein FRB94_014189 [Tulasnella sp. JGI-2019a]|nr:hypothetical protein FRB93_005463 [Tulasnella sp. JGI-2019a]KAG9014097.1 hypothetical protein FRB94_014189 [Tulasnella sp. JGI-2019a]
MATPSALLMDETLSQLLESINEGSLITPSLETPIQNMGLAETCQMVQNLELALRSFQDHVHLRLSQYRSHQNAIFPPISRLPVEIFSRILFQSVAVHDWTTIPDWSITRLQELAQVAKAWRDVILGTPEMWAVIKIHRRPGINPRWREDVDLVLERSRSAPLTVVYGVGKERYDSEIRDVRVVGEIFKLIGNHISRLQTIIYSGALSSTVATVLELPTPSLKHFHINSWNYYDPWGASQSMLPLRLSSGQKLLHVEAQNTPLIWSDFKGLTSLHLVKVEVEKDNDRLVEDLFVVLQSCPDLASLALDGIGPVADEGNAGSPDERSMQGILTCSRQIDLPSLWSLNIKNSAPALVLAIVFSVHATRVSNLHLQVGRYFLAALPDINAAQLIKPAFDRALNPCPETRLYIIQYSHSLKIQNYGDESWEKQPPRNASFEFHVILDKEVTEGDALERLSEFLQYSSRSIPVQLELGFGLAASENASCMIRFPVHILDQVVELRLNGNRNHTPEILYYLSQTRTQKGSNYKPTWICPRLASIWINYRKWKHIVTFLERRYSPHPAADDNFMAPARLQSITFVQSELPPDVPSQIRPFVEQWNCVEL